MMGAHVLVCDDEGPLRRMVVEYLTGRGYSCAEAATAEAMHGAMAGRKPDLLILDVRMPGTDGLTALRRLRGEGNDVPVIMLTAVSESVDRIVGLELGADDYLGKPVDLRELDARIKAVLRRQTSAVVKSREAATQLSFGDYQLDTTSARLTGPEGQDIEITAMEFALLKVFLEHRNRVLSRDQLLDLAHHKGWEPFDRSIDLRVSRLRRKIEPDANSPRFIKTVRGIGYIFAQG